MAKIFANPWFQVAAVPIILMIVGVLARRLGRRDGDDSSRRNDWAVGSTLLLMALGTILGDLRDAQSAIGDLPWWLVGVLLAAFISLDHDRYRSWERDNTTGLPKKDKRIFVGIVIPDILCLITFASYQAHKVNML
jgi:hypothetical protein